jgi:DNA-binding MarR family transcriptional regulator
MSKQPTKTPWKQPAWLQFTSIDDSVVPHHVPFPLVRRLDQIFSWAVADVLAGEVTDTSPQYAAVAVLADFPGIDQRRLAALMGLDRTNVGQVIDRLEAKGLVERRINGADRRARELNLTTQGKQIRRRLRPKMVEAQARVLAPLAPAEQDMLIELLIRVIKANEVNARPGAGRRKPRARTSSTENK